MPAQPQTVSIAQARTSTASGLLVLDTGANIVAALPNTALFARIASVTVSGPTPLSAAQMTLLIPISTKLHAATGTLQLSGSSTLNVAQLTSFETLPGFAIAASATTNLTATPAQFASLIFTHPTWLTAITSLSIQLDGSAMGAYPASQLNTFMTHGKVVTFVPTAGHSTLPIAAAAHDLATNAPALNALGSHVPLDFTVLNEGAVLSAADAVSLTTLQGFNPAAHTLAVSDTGANLTPRMAMLLGHGYGQIAVTSGILTASVPQLLNPTLHFVSGAHAQLAASATVSAATAASLAALPAFGAAGGAVLTVADSAANLAANDAAWLGVAGAVTLSADATISAAAAQPLAQIVSTLGSGFSLGGHSLTIADTLGALIALPGQIQSLASSLLLTADATVNAALISTFTLLPHAGTAGHTITVTDTAIALLALSPGALALTNATNLSADSAVNVAQANSLAALPSFSTNGHALTVSDTASNLVTLTSASLTKITLTLLSTDATVTAQQAQTLYADPGFSTAGHQLVIADTAANLVALPHTLLFASSFLELSTDAAVNAATLTQLTALGIKFTSAGHSITCDDTALNLAALSPAALALSSSQGLETSAVVSTAVATSLSALPNLTLAPGATLSIQDSVANLVSLGQIGNLPITVETLPPGSTVIITAAQAISLAALPHFSAAGATITVADTVAHLGSATAAISSLGCAVDVQDSAANLAANAGTALIQNASLVGLSGNAQVSAAAAAQIASIPHFSAGAYLLSVSDTASNIAHSKTSIAQLDAMAVVTDSGPVNITVSDQLATLAADGLLSFQGGNQLLVQDSFAALTSGSNSAGYALGARIGVLDTATNLVLAAAHDWLGLAPSYALSQAATVSGAVATSLAALGSHFSANGFALGVTDNATSTIAAAPALASLGIHAVVTDTAANLSAHANGLLGIESAISAIHVSDISPVTAAIAAGLTGLAGLLTGSVLQVVDTAAQIDASLPSLSNLGAHVAIIVSDTAANVAPYASDLTALGSPLTIEVTDRTAIDASTAGALAPLTANLATGTHFTVFDTAANIVSHAAALAAMGNSIGMITLSDGSTLSVSDAAAITALDGHLAPGYMLTVNGSINQVALNAVSLNKLNTDHHLASVNITGASVADATANLAALNNLPVRISVTDNAANVGSALDGLATLQGLQAISLTDGGTPALQISLATLAADASTLGKIVSAYSIAVVDTSVNIAADIGQGTASSLYEYLGQIGQVTASDSLPLVLTQTQILARSVDEAPGSILDKFTGRIAVTGVDVSHLQSVASLTHSPDTISVSDTAAHISTDLALGTSSVLLSTISRLGAIVAIDSQPILVTATQVLQPGMDDGPNSIIALLHGNSFSATNASVADLPQLASLPIQPTSIDVSDTASDIAADLGSVDPSLVANLATINSIKVTDGLTISLTEQEITASRVDDGIGSVLSKIVDGNISVSQVAAADVTAILSLPIAPVSISITDTAVHVVSNLSAEIENVSKISAIDVVGAPVTLTAPEALESNVDDGSGSLIGKLTGHGFLVSGASTAQLPSLLALTYAPSSIAVSDSSSNIIADLLSGNSMLARDASLISTISVSHGTLTLSGAQANTILGNAALASALAILAPATVVSVTGVPVSDVTRIVTSGWPHLSIQIADTAVNIAADLESGNSALGANAPHIANVVLTSDQTVTAAALAEIGSLQNFSTGGYSLTVQDNASAILAIPNQALTLAHAVDVIDSSVNVSRTLDALQNSFGGALTITLADTNPVISVTVATYNADRSTIDAITNPGIFHITGSADAISQIVADLASDTAVSNVVVEDSASNVIANLTALQVTGSKLLVTLTDTSITANLVAPLLALANLSPSGVEVSDTGSQIAAIVESGDGNAINYLNLYGSSLSDSTPVSAADAVALESLSRFTKAGSSLVVWDTVQHLTSPAFTAALANPLIDSVHLKTTSGTVVITASMATVLFAIANFTTDSPSGSQNTVTVSDTAAHLEANLTTLTANAAHIVHVIVGSSATVTGQTLTDLQNIGATAASGVSLTVNDTASTIAAAASALSASHSISASAWTLSGDATISESEAVALGGLTGFNTSLHTITLNLSNDMTISVSDANKLGSLSGSLDLNGHHLIVSGSVSQLQALSVSALSVVTPAIVDTATNIEGLSTASPLLQGTIEVTGNDSLSASDVAMLLNTVQASRAQGAAAGAVTFDSTHVVNDTIANLRALTASSAWSSSSAFHSAFRLVGQDTIANLTNPQNGAFLSSLYSSTLQSDVVVGAGTANTLASIAPTIHFTRGSYHVTLQDSASNLLNANYAHGLAIADAVQLLGPDHVDAADAGILLGIPNFRLVTPLTIIDSSTNLLDGAVSNVIAASGFAANIHVQLAGPEVLDAQTAEALVSLPGFADTQNLTVTDDPSYLLDTHNLAAEQMAVQVTLAGDEIVSANTVLRLSSVPHFSPGTSDLVLAGNDFADGGTLKAIADLGQNFDHNGHSLTMIADVLGLTPAEYEALQGDGVVRNGHALGITPSSASITDAGNVMTLAGEGVAGGTIKVYGADGALITSNAHMNAGFTATAADSGPGHNFSLTETAPAGSEGAPLVVLDTNLLEQALASAGGTFAGSGMIQVESGKFINLYTAGSVPALSHPALVYDPVAHTVALDVPGQSMITLVTLGGSTHPASLDVNEILFKTHG